MLPQMMMFTPERHLPTPGQHGPAPSGTPPPAQPPPPPQTRETQSHSAPNPLKRPILAPEGGPGTRGGTHRRRATFDLCQVRGVVLYVIVCGVVLDVCLFATCFSLQGPMVLFTPDHLLVFTGALGPIHTRPSPRVHRGPCFFSHPTISSCSQGPLILFTPDLLLVFTGAPFTGALDYCPQKHIKQP